MRPQRKLPKENLDHTLITPTDLRSRKTTTVEIDQPIKQESDYMKHYGDTNIEQALENDEIPMIEELEVTNLDTFCYKYGTIQPQKILLLA